MPSAPFRLKVAGKDGYQPGQCAASRCFEPSAVTDASGSTWPMAVPLCDRHWEIKCDAEERRDARD
jgi:hypothetical protein